MASAELLGLLLNAALLLAMVTVLDLVSAARDLSQTWVGRVVIGLATGLIGVGLMAAPVHAEPGIQFDTRSVLLSVSGLFFGPVPTAVAVVTTAVFRIWLGGAWVVGLLVIAASGSIGVLWSRWHPRGTTRRSVVSLWVLGVVVHVVMLALISQIPNGAGPRVLNVVALPVMLVYPLATVMLGLVLAHRLSRTRLIEERERLIAAIEQSDDSILMTTADGTIEYVNPAFEAVTGYSREEVIGRNPRILQSGQQDTATYGQLWQTILAGQTWRGRLINKRKDGTLFAEDATISPVRDGAGRVSSFVAVKRDVTREIELQAQYLQAQKMEGVGRLAAGVAHDFNNLLTIINGSAELAASAVAHDDPVAEDLRQILAAGARGSALTRQMLAFSRQQVSTPTVLDPDTLIEAFRRMMVRLIPEHISLDVCCGLDGACVSADAAQVEQVILNLVVNAKDAMPSGGTLRIETERVDVDTTIASVLRPVVTPGAYVRIGVVDSGVGMDDAVLARIFEPFFTTKAIGKGTGLGLATVLRIVDEHGGAVRVSSRVGAGSRFDVYLPVVERVEPPEARLVSTASPVTRATVLLVEDEEMLRAIAVRALTQVGFTVMTAGNGREGLEVAVAYLGELHLVVTDVIMPEMGGREMVEALRARRPGVPVLYTSGYTGDRDLAEWLSRTRAPFLAKPYSPADLVAAASAVIATQQHAE